MKPIITAYIKKTNKNPSTYEKKQLENLRLAYGTNLVMLAIRYSKGANMNEIGKYLMQIGGFRDNLDHNIKSIVIDAISAIKFFDYEKYSIAMRLTQATKPIKSTEYLQVYIKNFNESPYPFWKSIDTRYISEHKDFYPIRYGITNYGIQLTGFACKMFCQQDYPMNDNQVEFFKHWLNAAGNKDWDCIRSYYNQYPGSIGFHLQPILPLQYRLEKYLTAKVGREDVNEYKDFLWHAGKDLGVDTVIFLISCIPSCEISPYFLNKYIQEYIKESTFKSFRNFQYDMYLSDLGETEEGNENEEQDGFKDTIFDFDDKEDINFYEEKQYALTVDDRYYDYSLFDPDSLDSEESLYRLDNRYEDYDDEDEEYE